MYSFGRYWEKGIMHKLRLELLEEPCLLVGIFFLGFLKIVIIMGDVHIVVYLSILVLWVMVGKYKLI